MHIIQVVLNEKLKNAYKLKLYYGGDILIENTVVATKKESLKFLHEVMTLVVGEVHTAVVMGLAM